MNKDGRGVVFGGLILVSLLVLFFVGMNYVNATDVMSSVTVTATGDPFGKNNWTSYNKVETLNFTITFTGTETGDEPNVTNITIIVGNYSILDIPLLTNASDVTDNGTSSSADGFIWDCVSLHTLMVQSDTRNGIQCLNNTATGGINISAASANNFINIFFNVTLNETRYEQPVVWIVETQDQSGIMNKTEVSTNVDSLPPRFMEINISDGNTTLFNQSVGTLMSINESNILNGEQALTIEVTVEDANTNVGGEKPEVVELYYYINGSNDANATAIEYSGGVTRVNLTTTNTNSPYFYTGQINQSDARRGLGNLTSFVFIANDTQDNQEQKNSTEVNVAHSFIVNITSDTPVLHEMNASDGTNVVDDLDGGVEWLEESYGHVIEFEVGGFLDHTANDPGVKGVSVAYNTTGPITIGTNGYVGDAAGFVAIPNNLSTVSALDNSTVVFNMSLALVGSANDSNRIYFAILLNGTNGAYVSSYLRSYQVDSSPPAIPTLTVPTDRTIDISQSITYKCSADDSSSDEVTYSWTLTKPSGKTVTKSGAEVTFTSSDTNEAGSYNVQCTATDKVGNSITYTATSSETFNTLYSTGIGGEAGEGGEGAIAPTFDVDFSVSDEGTITGSEGRIRSFSFDGQTRHTLTIKDVTETSATIEIASDPVTVTLNVDESKEVDVNADGLNDMSVTLNSVTNGVADLTIRKVEEGAKVIAGEEEERRAAEEAARGEEAPVERVREAVGGLAWLWIVIIVVVIIAIGYYISKRK